MFSSPQKSSGKGSRRLFHRRTVKHRLLDCRDAASGAWLASELKCNPGHHCLKETRSRTRPKGQEIGGGQASKGRGMVKRHFASLSKPGRAGKAGSGAAAGMLILKPTSSNIKGGRGGKQNRRRRDGETHHDRRESAARAARDGMPLGDRHATATTQAKHSGYGRCWRRRWSKLRQTASAGRDGP